MNNEALPETEMQEIHEQALSPWSVKVRDLAISRGKFNPDTDIHSLETNDKKDGTHSVVAYKPHTKLPMDPECLVISTGRNPDGTKRQLRFIWRESEGPEQLYARQIDEIDKIIQVFESSKETDG